MQKPEIQAVVRGMVAEAQEKESNAESKAAPAPKAAPKTVEGPYKDNAGAYKKDDLVEYHSNAHQSWLPAVVINVEPAGGILLDLKPNTWIPKEQQATAVRPRVGGVVGSAPPRACASPMRQRSPSAGSAGTPRGSPQLGGGRPASRDGRPGSRGASPMHRSPSGNIGQPLSARGAAGSYRVGDLCEFWSNSHSDWLPAHVIKADGTGGIVIDLKPNTWISKDEQTLKIRPRRSGAVQRPSSANRRPSPSSANRLPQVGNSPQLPRPPMQRTPSWGNSDNRAPSPAGWREGLRAPSPSGRAREMTPLRAPSPSGRALTPGRAPSPSGRVLYSPRGYGAQNPSRPPRVSASPLRAGGAAIAGM